MNRPLFLDTNAIIRIFKGTNDAARQALNNATRIAIPLVVYAEIKAGLDSQPSLRRKERELFESLLATPGVEIHRPTEKTANFYSRIFNQLKKQGTPIPTNDIWIAAETMDADGTLFSDDHHFRSIPMLDLYNH